MTISQAAVARIGRPLGIVLRSDFLRHGALVFGATMLVNLCSYFFHFVALRRMSVAEYGALSSLIAVLGIMSGPAAILATVVVKYAADFHALDETAKLAYLFRRLLYGTALLSCAIVLTALVFRDAVGAYLQIDQTLPQMLIAISIGLSFMIAGTRSILQGTQQFGSFAISASIEGVGRAAFAIVLLYAGLGIPGALGGFVAATLASLAYTLVQSARLLRGTSPRPWPLDLRRLTRTVGGVAVSTLCLLTMGFFDVLIVKHFFSPHEAGLYSAVALAGRGLFFVLNFLPAIVLPKAANLASSGRNPIPVIVQSALTAAALAAAVLAVLAVVPLQWIAGAQYAQAAPYVVEYGLATTFLAGASLAATYKIALHRFDFIVPLAAALVVEAIVLNLYHPSLRAVITVLLVGHGCAFLGSLFRISAPTDERVLAIARS
jgi:O-antigen/teichoic acid export membrane protein